MYSDYLNETLGQNMIKTDYGFATYHLNKISKILDVTDMYVEPDQRNGATFKKLYNEIKEVAIKGDCVKIVCSVETFQKKPEKAMLMMLRMNFKFSHINDEVIYFYKKHGGYYLMEYQNTIYPEEDYRAFGKALTEALPELDDELEDQAIIDMFNEVRAKDPNASIEEIVEATTKVVPAIKTEIEGKMAGGDAGENLAALNLVGE